MRFIVRRNTTQLAATTKQVVASCPVSAVVRNGRWLAEVPSGGACGPFLKQVKRLPTETRKNLGRHLVGFDSETLALIDDLRH